MAKINCKFCGVDSTVQKGRLYCSRKCYGLDHRKELNRTCERCLKKFRSVAYWRYCSVKCRILNNIDCLCCGKSFHPRDKYKKYCSVKCSCNDVNRRNKISNTLKKKKIIPPSRRGISPPNKGEVGFKHSGSFKSGKNHYNWSGKTSEEKLQNKWEREMFRKHVSPFVLARDEYTCVVCGKKGSYLHAHHKMKWSKYPDFRFDASICVTVCRGSCHWELEKSVIC